MNGMYFIPIFSVVIVGMLSKRVPASAASTALISGLVIIGCGYFVPPLAVIVDSMHEYHFLGVVFVYLVFYMLIMAELRPTRDFNQKDAGAVDLTPWPYVRIASLLLVLSVVAIYVVFADFAALQ
jgi:SSS family solute:Na+ symporter